MAKPRHAAGDVIGPWEVLEYLGYGDKGGAGRSRHRYQCKCINCGTMRVKRQDDLKDYVEYCANCRPSHSYGPERGKPVNNKVEASDFLRMKLR